mmetsp:Transcript_24651/g.73321  ORF Transcript_24651/g.73321 Transcript_24651/m.73321 type:complete len:323 (-) Transcript_24651:46-1014(-)
MLRAGARAHRRHDPQGAAGMLLVRQRLGSGKPRGRVRRVSRPGSVGSGWVQRDHLRVRPDRRRKDVHDVRLARAARRRLAHHARALQDHRRDGAPLRGDGHRVDGGDVQQHPHRPPPGGEAAWLELALPHEAQRQKRRGELRRGGPARRVGGGGRGGPPDAARSRPGAEDRRGQRHEHRELALAPHLHDPGDDRGPRDAVDEPGQDPAVRPRRLRAAQEDGVRGEPQEGGDRDQQVPHGAGQRHRGRRQKNEAGALPRAQADTDHAGLDRGLRQDPDVRELLPGLVECQRDVDVPHLRRARQEGNKPWGSVAIIKNTLLAVW